MTWVLLRGLIREARHWEDFPDLWRRRIAPEPVWTPDLPGNGTLSHLRSPASVAGMAEELRRRLREQGAPPPYRLVSLSLGAMVTVSWMSRWPDEIASAALINTSVGRFSPPWRRLRPAVYGRLIGDVLLARDPVEREFTILKLTSNLREREELRHLAARWADYGRERPVGRLNTLRQLWAALRFRAPEAVPASVPVLVVSGGGDRLVDPRCSQALAAGWGLPLVRHPRAGHDLPLDAPEWLAQRLLEWSSGR